MYRSATGNYPRAGGICWDCLWQTGMYSHPRVIYFSVLDENLLYSLRHSNSRETESSHTIEKVASPLCTQHLISCLAHGRCPTDLHCGIIIEYNYEVFILPPHTNSHV